MRPALVGSTPSPRGPHSVGGSPGWASSSALVGWPSPELLPQCPPCFPPWPVWEEEEEEEEEGLFKADAVNEEDPERDRATQVGGEVEGVTEEGLPV